MNNIKKYLTPTDTEEVRPDLFIKKTKKGYRRMYPIVWNDNYRWKEQLKTIFSLRTFFTMALIIFIAWSYVHDTQACFNVLEKIGLLCNDNPDACLEYGFTDEEYSLGRDVIDEDTHTLRIYPEEN